MMSFIKIFLLFNQIKIDVLITNFNIILKEKIKIKYYHFIRYILYL
jgi:hypothetical protein